MATVAEALSALNIDKWVLSDEPKTEAEFNKYFKKCIGEDDNGSSILSSNPSDFDVTWNQITAKQKELETAYKNNKYQRDRAIAYPSIVDQLDDLYHNGIDGWKTTIKAIKDKYPKG
tara:strand:+ start:224 stop:574 length:351 start_codon:yes stop_codon:yes gene_type:complete